MEVKKQFQIIKGKKKLVMIGYKAIMFPSVSPKKIETLHNIKARAFPLSIEPLGKNINTV
jgi:hypothetical protein